jgi:hypothetical protein
MPYIGGRTSRQLPPYGCPKVDANPSMGRKLFKGDEAAPHRAEAALAGVALLRVLQHDGGRGELERIACGHQPHRGLGAHRRSSIGWALLPSRVLQHAVSLVRSLRGGSLSVRDVGAAEITCLCETVSCRPQPGKPAARYWALADRRFDQVRRTTSDQRHRRRVLHLIWSERLPPQVLRHFRQLSGLDDLAEGLASPSNG